MSEFDLYMKRLTGALTVKADESLDCSIFFNIAIYISVSGRGSKCFKIGDLI